MTLCLFVCAAASGACAEGDPAPSTDSADSFVIPPPLQPVSEIRLRESDSTYLSRPYLIAVSRQGEMLIVDGASRTILRFDDTGVLQGTLGRWGYGPNEYVQPSTVLSIDDSTILINDDLRRSVLLWDVRGNAVRTRFPTKNTGVVPRFASAKGSVVGTFVDRARGTIGVKWRLPSGSHTDVGVIRAGAETFASAWGSMELAMWDDSVAYLGDNSEFIKIADSTWTPVDSIRVPRRLRRRVPHALHTTLSPGQNINDIIGRLSTPFALHRLSAGRFAVVYGDPAIHPAGENQWRVTGAEFLTVVARGKRSRCVDIPIPANDNDLPAVTFRGDTMYVLDHHVEGNSAVGDVRKYLIGTDLC